jgi:hypothetical protein
MDPVIVKAYMMPHLPHDQFPLLADEDFAANLRAKAFPYLDVFNTGYKGHIFWPLMRVFSPLCSIFSKDPLFSYTLHRMRIHTFGGHGHYPR